MRFTMLVATVGLVAGVGCGGGGNGASTTGPPTGPPTTPPANTIFIQASSFNPSSMTVAAGTVVTFTIQSGPPHDVTFSQNPPAEGNVPLSNSGSFQRTFNTVGVSQFRCEFHGFQGSITVQ